MLQYFAVAMSYNELSIGRGNALKCVPQKKSWAGKGQEYDIQGKSGDNEKISQVFG